MIPYDGSISTEIVLGELKSRADFAGTEHDALIVISDVWLADSAEEFANVATARRLKVALAGASSHVQARRAREEERMLSREAHQRITSMFPLWNVEVETLPGFSLVSSEILEKVKDSNTDIIAIDVGESFADKVSHYGAGALRVANEVAYNVFIARAKGTNGVRRLGEHIEFPPIRIVLVLDGTSADERILQTVARRKWARDSEVRVVLSDSNRTVVDETQATAILQAAGLNVSVDRLQMDSPSMLSQAVIDWKPDCIFTCGEPTTSRGQRRLKSETTDLLQWANCSVELVRGPQARPKVMRAAA
jgi:hypothetical protein